VKPTRAEIAAASDTTIEDVIRPGLRVLFCGINPGLYSAATGHHFARPGNRFWPALHRGGFTPRQLHAAEQQQLLSYGLGITNIVARASTRADELTRAEIVAGGAILKDKVRRYRPGWLAVLGIGAYKTAFDARTDRERRASAGFASSARAPRINIGSQPEPIGDTRVWVLPNPSGLNAHYTLDALTAEFAKLHDAAMDDS